MKISNINPKIAECNQEIKKEDFDFINTITQKYQGVTGIAGINAEKENKGNEVVLSILYKYKDYFIYCAHKDHKTFYYLKFYRINEKDILKFEELKENELREIDKMYINGYYKKELDFVKELEDYKKMIRIKNF